MMTINVRVTPYERDNLKALATVTLGSGIKLHGIRVMENKDGRMFVSYPAYKTKTGEFEQYFHPITKEFNEKLNNAILTAYDSENHRFSTQSETVIDPAVSVRAAEFRQANMRGLASVILDDSFVINSVRIMRGEHGLFTSMPSYRDKNGEYQDYVELKGDIRGVIRDKSVEALTNAKVNQADKTASKSVSGQTEKEKNTVSSNVGDKMKAEGKKQGQQARQVQKQSGMMAVR